LVSCYWLIEGIVLLDFPYVLPNVKVKNFLPLESMWNLIDQPIQRIIMTKFPDKEDLVYDYAVHWYEIVIVLAWTALFIFLSYRLLKKRDL